MLKINKIIILIFVIMLFSCATNTVDSSNDTSFVNSSVAQNLITAVDLSYVNEMEDCGATYRVKGKVVDPFKIFHDYGADLVRVRLWNDAKWTKYSNFADVAKTIRRSKKQGMQTMLDFHYSDDWADPEKQVVPRAWRDDFADDNKLAQHLYKYTYDVLYKLNKQGLMPDMVQIGNEINQGMLHYKRLKKGKKRTVNWSRTAKFLNSGLKAVADVSRLSIIKPKTMIHIAQPENIIPWFNKVIKAGLTKFDYIGFSYYPLWSKYQIKQLTTVMKKIKQTFNIDLFLVETAYPWTLDWSDAAANLMNKNSLLEGYPATISGQNKYMLDLTKAVINGGGIGIAYWEPAWVSTKCKTRWGTGSHWENMTFFDFNNNNEVHDGISYLKAFK